MAPSIEPDGFEREAGRIRVQVSAILKKWGLLPRFKRWRLAKDPDTGMIVLFGILNDGYIAAHTPIPFGDYFLPRVLHDLANQLQVQVVSCNSDGLRYAFILDRGRLDNLPTHIDFPYVDDGKVLVRVVYGDNPQHMGASSAAVDDHKLVDPGVGAFLKVLDDIQVTSGAAYQLSGQELPGIMAIDEEEFNRRVEEHEADRRRSMQIKKLFDETTE